MFTIYVSGFAEDTEPSFSLHLQAPILSMDGNPLVPLGRNRGAQGPKQRRLPSIPASWGEEPRTKAGSGARQLTSKETEGARSRQASPQLKLLTENQGKLTPTDFPGGNLALSFGSPTERTGTECSSLSLASVSQDKPKQKNQRQSVSGGSAFIPVSTCPRG